MGGLRELCKYHLQEIRTLFFAQTSYSQDQDVLEILEIIQKDFVLMASEKV